VLYTKVVELQNPQIVLAAIDARVMGEMLEKASSQWSTLRLPSCRDLGSVYRTTVPEVSTKALATPMLQTGAGTVERRLG
jgi:hypothetical protein